MSAAFQQFPSTFNISPSTMPGQSLSHLQTKDLVTPRRWDLAVKWRHFRHLLHGGDHNAERIYRWHIQARKTANAKLGLGMDSKSGTDQYVSDCHRLLVSMRANGFCSEYAIPIDPDGELLGGAHRTACALALEIETVPVERRTNTAWAPAWGEEWFIANGMPDAYLDRLRKDWQELNGLSDRR